MPAHAQLVFLSLFLSSCVPFFDALPLSNGSIDLCTDPSFDAAVSLSGAHILLFKGPSMWVLDLNNYSIDAARPNSYLIDACLNSAPSKELAADPYYLWNRHGDFAYYKNQICIYRVSLNVTFPFISLHLQTLTFPHCRERQFANFQ